MTPQTQFTKKITEALWFTFDKGGPIREQEIDQVREHLQYDGPSLYAALQRLARIVSTRCSQEDTEAMLMLFEAKKALDLGSSTPH